MPPRPKNPPADRRQEILAAARRVFARQGYDAATNAAIAREAGVTPAALYYYFPSKADLFRAVVTERRDTLMPILQQLHAVLRDIPPATLLPMVLHNVATFMTEEHTQSLMRIIFSEGPRNPELVQIWQSQAVGPAAELLLGYLQHQMNRGALLDTDPRAMAVMLIGPLLMVGFARDLLQLPLLEGLANDTLIAALTRGLLHGLVPLPSTAQTTANDGE